MKRKLNILRAFLLLAVLTPLLSSCGYNSMVNREEAVTAQWAQVENVYQRRMDLIPNLVNTVQGSANFEKSTLEAVIQARASATQVKVDASKLTPEQIDHFDQTQSQLTSSLSRLLVAVESYPNLKSNANFQQLMDELAGTENRISVERKRFNEVVLDYNAYIRRFPNNITASMFGFKSKGYFKATEGAEKAPTVTFPDFKK